MYNLVSDSDFSSWRVMFSYLKELSSNPKEIFNEPIPDIPPGPTFDQRLHHQLMADLKALYVAITRAMVKLVWYERDWDERMGPFRLLFQHHSLVQEVPLSAESAALLRRTSSPEEWCRRGRMMFASQQYGQARMCFTRAGELLLAAWADACFVQDQARTAAVQQKRGSNKAKTLFCKAAQLFEAAQKFPQAAECFERARQYLEAGRVFSQLISPPRWDDAARCFELGGGWDQAAEAHEQRAECTGRITLSGLRCVERSLGCCLEDSSDPTSKALEIMERQLDATHGSTVDDKTAPLASETGELKEVLLYILALKHHRAGRTHDMMGLLMQLSSPAKQRRFLRSRGYHDELIKVTFPDAITCLLMLIPAATALILTISHFPDSGGGAGRQPGSSR